MSRFQRQLNRHGVQPKASGKKAARKANRRKSSKQRQQRWTEHETLPQPSGKLAITVTRPASHGQTEATTIERTLAVATASPGKFLESFLAKAAEGADLKRPEKSHRKNGLVIQGSASHV